MGDTEIPSDLTEFWVITSQKGRFTQPIHNLACELNTAVQMCPIISKAGNDELRFHDIGRRAHQRWSGPSGECGLAGLVLVLYEPPANGIVHAVALRSTNPAS